jgi:tetratricopeptide (TPR) repeat protein
VWLKTLADFEAKYSEMADFAYFREPKMSCLLKTKRFDEAKKAGEKLVAQGLRRGDEDALRWLSNYFLGLPAADQKTCEAVMVQAAEAYLSLAGTSDFTALKNLAETHYALGHFAEASKYGNRALEVGTQDQKRDFAFRVRMFEKAK